MLFPTTDLSTVLSNLGLGQAAIPQTQYPTVTSGNQVNLTNTSIVALINNQSITNKPGSIDLIINQIDKPLPLIFVDKTFGKKIGAIVNSSVPIRFDQSELSINFYGITNNQLSLVVQTSINTDRTFFYIGRINGVGSIFFGGLISNQSLNSTIYHFGAPQTICCHTVSILTNGRRQRYGIYNRKSRIAINASNIIIDRLVALNYSLFYQSQLTSEQLERIEQRLLLNTSRFR